MKILLFVLAFASVNVFAHGENKPGPNGGHIRMPGAFHTELVLEPQSAKVFLLDISFKNPTTVESSVSLHFMSGAKHVEATCLGKKNYFECQIPGKISQYSGIHLKASRMGAIGKDAHYPLPLSFASIKVQPSNNHNHHNH